jgi:hypothetical protein
MIKYRGLVEKEIAGKKVFFKFNMAAIEMLGDLQDMGASKILTSGGEAKLSTLSAFLYSGAVQYCKQEKKVPDFTREDATEWVAELGLNEVLTMFITCFTGPKVDEEKNVTATPNGDLTTQSNSQLSNVALAPESITS